MTHTNQTFPGNGPSFLLGRDLSAVGVQKGSWGTSCLIIFLGDELSGASWRSVVTIVLFFPWRCLQVRKLEFCLSKCTENTLLWGLTSDCSTVMESSKVSFRITRFQIMLCLPQVVILSMNAYVRGEGDWKTSLLIILCWFTILCVRTKHAF